MFIPKSMRRSEIFNFKWDNIDYGYGFIELLETKANKSRKIPFQKKLMNVFEEQPKAYSGDTFG